MGFLRGLLTEKWLTIVMVLLAVLSALLLPGALPAALEIMALKVMGVALLLAVVFVLIYVLRGTDYDFYEEILGQHNIAGAILVSALIIAVAMVVGP
jgi:hypothetical protein